MAPSVSHGIKQSALTALSTRKVDGSGLSIAICATQWNTSIIQSLSGACTEELQRLGVLAENITVKMVPGAYELPYAANQLAASGKFDAIVCIGCLIKGDTMHFEYIAEAVTQGIMQVNLKSRIPVLFGVLTCLNEDQAKIRAGLGPKSSNHGIEWAQSAIEMARLRQTTLRDIKEHDCKCPVKTPIGSHVLAIVAATVCILLSLRR